MVFISHDLQTVQRLCERVLVMNHGNLVFDGAADDAIRAYMQARPLAQTPRILTAHSVPGRITHVALIDEFDRPSSNFRTGCPLRVRVDIKIEEPFAGGCIEFWIYNFMRQVVCRFTTTDRKLDFAPGEYSIEFCCPELPVHSGAYTADVALESVSAFLDSDYHQDCVSFYVERGAYTTGILFAPHSYRVTQKESRAVGTVSDQVQGN
jgi:hypothetical protein